MAKFKVGDRVRFVRGIDAQGNDCFLHGLPIGSTGVIVRGANLKSKNNWEWVVRYDKYRHEPVQNLAWDECFADGCMLEPITDTWAQDKVAQLVKQCMPVAA